jgi:hypothetical protein
VGERREAEREEGEEEKDMRLWDTRNKREGEREVRGKDKRNR